MIQQILKNFNLAEKEILVFKKALEFGSQPASNIARITELPRNTVRSILDNLVKKGLLVKTNRANTQYYAVEKKENIIRSLKHRKLTLNEEIDNQISLIENYGDELSLRHNSKSRPKITFYEGEAGLEKVYEDTLSSKEEIVSWASFEGMTDALPKYFDTYFARRAKKKINIRSIHPDSKIAREKTKNDLKEMRTSLLIPADKYNFVPEIQIYNNKINISSWKEKIAIIIESAEIAQAMKTIFELSWIGAESLKNAKKK
jgi:sugar-specific transcriptional regulator TrmB